MNITKTVLGGIQNLFVSVVEHAMSVQGDTTTYFYDGVKKYVHYKDSDGYEWWSEYDENGNEIHYKDSKGYETWSEYDKNGNETHFKDSEGYERWSDDNPDKPISEEDVKPFEFNS